MEGNRRPQSWTWMVLTAGLLIILSVLAYLNVQLSISNGFRYAGDLRIAFLLICLAFLAGAISGLTQLSKR
jgi:zinc transporter ZupT